MLTWKAILGFFAIAGQDVGIVAELEDAEVDLHLAGVGGDRRRRASGLVELVHGAVVQGREDVAVDDQHRLGGTLQQGQAARGSQRRFLAAVVDPGAEFPAVAAEGLDQLGQVAGDDRDVAEAEPGELAEHDLDDRHRVVLAQRHQRLGQHVRVRPQPGPLASCQQHGLHSCISPSVDRHLKRVSWTRPAVGSAPGLLAGSRNAPRAAGSPRACRGASWLFRAAATSWKTLTSAATWRSKVCSAPAGLPGPTWPGGARRRSCDRAPRSARPARRVRSGCSPPGRRSSARWPRSGPW